MMDARTGISDFLEIDPAQLVEMRRQGALKLIDVRTDAEVAVGMIAGANHLPLHLLPQRITELDPASPIVLYCKSGARSAQACAFLATQGFGQVFNLRGGVLAWQRSGYELELSQPADDTTRLGL